MPAKLRILFVGSAGAMSVEPLLALVQSKHEVVGVVINDTHLPTRSIKLIPAKETDNIESIAFDNKIPILRLKGSFSNLQVPIENLYPDLIITSCFNRKIPIKILSMPKIASLNIHPSLLPRYRGPSPLFWQLRNGEKHTGITIHLMDADFDSGHIVIQESMGLSGYEAFDDLKQALSVLAVKLLFKALNDIKNRVYDAKPQDESKATYYSRFYQDNESGFH